jgi:GH15 family glucan-1,4-alpha-glucosidase
VVGGGSGASNHHRSPRPGGALTDAAAAGRPMTERGPDGYAPIDAYAAIGDGRTVALIADDARIDWWPVSAIDATPSYAALLDSDAGGYIALSPVGPYTSRRRYLPDTNVLETTFTTADGVVKVTDALPVGNFGLLAWSELVRRVDGVSGTVELTWEVRPGNQFGKSQPWTVEHDNTVLVHVGEELAALRCWDVGEPETDGHRVSGRFKVTAPSRHLLAVTAGVDTPVFLPDRDEIDRRLDGTVQRWRDWANGINYDGPWEREVRRSALVLKLLIYAPTGAIIAAPTTSLPERIGGDKNWDYRYMWVRDCSFTIDALLNLQLHNEAQAAVQWMLGALRRTAPELHVFYRLDGTKAPDNVTEVPLDGYRGSRPVRAGNAAATQTQLGTFGDLFNMIWLYVEAGHHLDPQTGGLLADLADRCCDEWQQPDAGVWELNEQRHYTASKIGCWTALDRAIRLHECGQLPTAHLDRWKIERERIAEWVHTNCWSERKQSFTFYAGTEDLDAATLLAARTGFDRGARLAGTIEAIRHELADGAMVYRYSGAEREEGAFLACTFWLVNALVLHGDLDAARELMDQAVLLANDVGLYAEQIDPRRVEMLGNFPQGLSHLALVNAACAYREATRD